MKPLFTLEGTAVSWSIITAAAVGSDAGTLGVLNIKTWNGMFAEYVEYPVALDDVSGEFARDMDIIGKSVKVSIIHMDCVPEARNFAVIGHALFFGLDLALA